MGVALARLKPHRPDRLASKILTSRKKPPTSIGLYLNLPRHAALFCVDEKTAIQSPRPVGSENLSRLWNSRSLPIGRVWRL